MELEKLMAKVKGLLVSVADLTRYALENTDTVDEAEALIEGITDQIEKTLREKVQ